MRRVVVTEPLVHRLTSLRHWRGPRVLCTDPGEGRIDAVLRIMFLRLSQRNEGVHRRRIIASWASGAGGTYTAAAPITLTLIVAGVLFCDGLLDAEAAAAAVWDGQCPFVLAPRDAALHTGVEPLVAFLAALPCA